MGKRIITRRRGRQKGRFTVPSHRFKGRINYPNFEADKGIISDIFHDPGHTAPLATVRFDSGEEIKIPAPEGAQVGEEINFTKKKQGQKKGNVLPIGKITEGAPVYNIELSPGDGGKLVRSGGTNAIVVSQSGKKTVVQLPSGKFKTLDSDCRATIGVAAGGGRKDKPFLKAGKKHIARKRRGRLFPKVRGIAMDPVDHPHGGGGHQHIGKSTTVRRSTPPGRKVGSISAKKTGRGK
ncbi:MAG: 50S ribosomal protein L2 [Candidatus Thermoplasmatota archaeon]